LPSDLPTPTEAGFAKAGATMAGQAKNQERFYSYFL
jgi:hypothetical protein